MAEVRHRGEGHGGGEQDGEDHPEGGVDRQQHALIAGGACAGVTQPECCRAAMAWRQTLVLT